MSLIYRKMDSDGDYILGNNSYGFYKDVEAVAQAIQTNIKLLQGEWWEDVEIGTPLFQKMLGRSMTDERKDAIDLIIKDRIMNTKDVETITSFESEFDMRTRTYTMICNISTSYGEIKDLKINKSLE